MLAKSLGKVHYFSEKKERELLDLKQQWGFGDPRNTSEYQECDVCANSIFRDTWDKSGVEQRAFEPPPAMSQGDSCPTSPAAGEGTGSEEDLVRMITDRVMQALNSKGVA